MTDTPRLPVLSLVLGSLALLVASSPAGAETWRRYVNERFGTAAEYPADMFVMQPPPDNGDGRTFVSKDGRSEIRIYGSYSPSVVTNSFEEYRRWLTDTEKENGVTITYAPGGDGWFALSGSKGAMIVYRKVMAGCPDRSVGHHVSIEYPAADKAKFDPIVARISRSLRAASNNAC